MRFCTFINYLNKYIFLDNSNLTVNINKLTEQLYLAFILI